MPTHDVDRYKDGYVWVEYCKNCGKEGSLLSEECEEIFIKQAIDPSTPLCHPISGEPFRFTEMTRKEFDEKYGIDVDKPKERS